MYVNADTVIKAAAVLTAILAIGGVVYKVISWVQRQKRQDEDIAAMNADAIGYCSPIPDAVALLDEEYQTSEVTNPTDELLARCEVYFDLDEVILKNIFTPLYDEVLNAKVQK